MSSVALYDITVVYFIRLLKSQSAFLAKSQKWCADNGKPDSYLLDARLAPDMHKLPFQVLVTTNMSRSGVLGPDWKFLPPSVEIETTEQDFAGMQARIQRALDALEAIKPEDLDSSAPVSIWPSGVEGRGPNFKFGSGLTFLTQFVIPNFQFHLVTSYNLCRHMGVPLGKIDYIANEPFA